VRYASTYQKQIEIVQGKRSGKAFVKNTRITVDHVISWLASGMTAKEIVEDYPG
jgi:uncharacterized protein (DUF433 family)